jgi:hypothetical protein
VQHEVRPHLQLHQHGDGRPLAVEQPGDRPGEIEREPDDRDGRVAAVQLAAAGVPGVGRDGDAEPQARPAGGELADQRPGGVHLAEADGVDQHARPGVAGAAGTSRAVRSRNALSTFRRALGTSNHAGAAAVTSVRQTMS